MSTNKKFTKNSKTRDDRNDIEPKEEQKGFRKGKGNYRKNDASWYTKAGTQLVLDAGRLSFNVPSGSKIMWDTSSIVNVINTRDKSDYVLPGVCRLSYVPVYGIAKSANDPLNVAARNIYSWIRHANSGSRNYDPNDLMLYLMAMDNCYIYYQRMVRIYGVARVFSQLNRHLPNSLAQALDFDYNDIIENLSDFRAYINMVSAKLGSLCVPADMPIYERHMWMNAGVFSDAPTAKAQMYVFTPTIVGQYDERTASTGGKLIPISVGGNDTFASMKSTMDSLVNAIISSEDCGIISGDIRKAYGDRLISLAGIGDEYTVVPVYSEEVLRQIQNATVLRSIKFDGLDPALFKQDLNDNILKTGYTFDVDSSFYAGNRIMTGSDAQPTPEEVLVNSRFMIVGEVTANSDATSSKHNTYNLDPTSIGTEAIVGLAIFGVGDASSETHTSPVLAYCMKYENLINTITTQNANIQSFLSAYSKMENFNYHPRVGTMFAVGTVGPSDNTITLEKVFTFQDVDNYCVVNDTVLYNLHNTALLSLFDVPVMGVK